ncbi:unnamed protein product, partial [Heterotrigona itama]
NATQSNKKTQIKITNPSRVTHQHISNKTQYQTKTQVTKSQNTKPLPIYEHGNINHAKILDAFREKYNNAFQIKFTFNKLKIMFANLNDFTENYLPEGKH